MTSLILGHGASGDAASMRPYVQALSGHGITATAIDLPRGNAERATSRFVEALRASSAAIGGHSYGGRVASLVAAEREVSGLVLLSYPLHRPGHPEDLRTEHWARIGCPVLVLSGESDPFAQLALLRQEVRRLPQATLHTWPGVGHGLTPVLDDAVQHIAEFVRSLGA